MRNDRPWALISSFKKSVEATGGACRRVSVGVP